MPMIFTLPTGSGPMESRAAGFTLVEMIVTIAILSILATGILPLSQVTYKRTREIELKRGLRVIRNALDEYKKFVDDDKIEKKADGHGYPESLEVLVEGAALKGPVEKRVKFLRRIPRDPMTENGKWGLRSYVDEPDSTVWGGQDVYDVYSTSDETALDGTPYGTW